MKRQTIRRRAPILPIAAAIAAIAALSVPLASAAPQKDESFRESVKRARASLGHLSAAVVATPDGAAATALAQNRQHTRAVARGALRGKRGARGGRSLRRAATAGRLEAANLNAYVSLFAAAELPLQLDLLEAIGQAHRSCERIIGLLVGIREHVPEDKRERLDALIAEIRAKCEMLGDPEATLEACRSALVALRDFVLAHKGEFPPSPATIEEGLMLAGEVVERCAPLLPPPGDGWGPIPPDWGATPPDWGGDGGSP